MEKVIFIDDEASFFCKRYTAALSTTYDVTICEDLLDGYEAIRCDKLIKAIILDIMMPVPAPIQREMPRLTKTNAGIWLIEKVFGILIQRNIALLILTNRNVPNIEKAVKTICNKAECNPSRNLRYKVQAKEMCDSTSIVSEVRSLLAK